MSNGDSSHGGAGGSSGLFFSASEDEDFAEGVPRGVAEVVMMAQEGSDEEGGTAETPAASVSSATAARLQGSEGIPFSDTAASPTTPATLSRHPERPIRVPLTQPAAAFTEDRIAERRAALRGLLASPDIGEREVGGTCSVGCLAERH